MWNKHVFIYENIRFWGPMDLIDLLYLVNEMYEWHETEFCIYVCTNDTKRSVRGCQYQFLSTVETTPSQMD